MKSRICALVGECYEGRLLDCHLIVPESVDIEEAKAAWRKWYNEVYKADPNPSKYIDFETFLIDNYGCEVTEQIEVIDH